jgi:hypothetical protein
LILSIYSQHHIPVCKKLCKFLHSCLAPVGTSAQLPLKSNEQRFVRVSACAGFVLLGLFLGSALFVVLITLWRNLAPA